MTMRSMSYVKFTAEHKTHGVEKRSKTLQSTEKRSCRSLSNKFESMIFFRIPQSVPVVYQFIIEFEVIQS